jgi:hypothetical protein
MVEIKRTRINACEKRRYLLSVNMNENERKPGEN